VHRVIRATLFLGVSIYSLLGTTGAWADRPTLRFTEGIRASLRSKESEPSELTERAEIELIPKEEWWKIVPFVEARRNLDSSSWSRVELGTELGLRTFWLSSDPPPWFLKPLAWFHVEGGFYERWYSPKINLSENHRPADKNLELFPSKPHPEWRTRTTFDIPLPWSCFSKPLGVYALNEYYYDLQEGRGIRNEVGAGIKIPLPGSHFSTRLGWRHVDLVHLSDADQFEGSVQVEF